MGNSLNKQRGIKVAKPERRVSKEELAALKEAFNRIQDGHMISDLQFHIEVLGPQVPESIAMKIFSLFVSDEQNADAMSFDDLLACYVVFKHGSPEEMAQICFELMKMTINNGQSTAGSNDFINRDHVQTFTEKLISQNEQLVHSFYAKTEFDPRLPIRKDDFVSVFKRVQQLQLFTWVPKLVEGYSRECLNIDEGATRSTVDKRLTMIQHERARTEAERLGFTAAEHDAMQEFFNREMKRNDAKAVMATIEFMFKDIDNPKLRRYMIDALTKHKALDFKSLTALAFTICKETEEEKKLNFLFDIFSFYSEDSMKKKQMREFAEIFNLGAAFFQSRGASISREDFIADVSNLQLDFKLYEKAKFTLIAMLALKPQSDEEEREAILSVLNYNHNIEAYVHEHLQECQMHYIIQKSFFDAWSTNVGFGGLTQSSLHIKREEKHKIIDNKSLLEPDHQYRLREVESGTDFIIVPHYVFFALSRWYQCNHVIERKVIQYKGSSMKIKNKLSGGGTHSIAPTTGGGSQKVSEHYVKIVGDMTYELEIYPKLLYFEKITEKGERPHQKAIVNQRIDQNYMRKVLKSDKLPLFELQTSRKATFEEVLKQMSASLNENAKRGRLWIEDQIISGAKLEETLEDFGISLGQVVYVEYANNSNQWPTDLIQEKARASFGTQVGEDLRDLRSNGLYNLGNTCYMNSALQCLANTRFFYEFFISERRYLRQMNLESKHGHQGELANNFAGLMQKLWAPSGQVAVPRQFKNAISGISEQFQGYDQQDSQEFLSFLLDGLHEELNLRKEKPYFENPDSDSRNVLDLGLENWSNALRRDWSFIYFMFFGQLKSTLNCQTCNKVSVTFDNINSIPLSLPEPSKILLNIIVYRLPSDIKTLLQGGRSQLKKLDSFRSDDGAIEGQTAVPPSLTPIEYDHKEDNHQFQESIKSLMNNQPIRVSIRVDKDAKIGQIMCQIAGIKEVNVDLGSRHTTLILYAQTKGVIRGIFNTEYRLTQYHVSQNEIEAIEVMTKHGREQIRENYRKNPDDEKLQHLATLMSASEKPIEDPLKQAITSSSSTTASKKGSKKQASLPRPVAGRDPNYGIKIDRCNLFNSYPIAVEKFDEFDENCNFPEDVYAIAYHRRFVKKQHAFFQPFQPQLFSSPLILILPLKPTGKRVYEEVWSVASNLLKRNSIYHDRRNRWWEQRNWEDLLDPSKLHSDPPVFKPFVIKMVDRGGYTCSQCHWMKMCSGCVLPPGDEFIEDFFKKLHLSIEWHSSLIEDDYNHQVNEVIQHSSTSDKEIQDDGFLNLEDCLRKFHETEEISDHIFCGACKKPQAHLKRLEIFRPPPVLVVQLKRFKFSSTFKNKLTTLVEFPLFNLDLSSFVNDQDYLKSMGIELKYDLYGMINHYGSLNLGHYTSVVRNQSDGKWYQYDDSQRSLLDEDQIHKEHAYILFYIRKDVQTKTLDQVIPNIAKDFFPGKPVSTQKGNAFIIEKSSQDSFKIQYEKGKETEIVRVDDILEEKDQNEITYDSKKLQEIESQKKERLAEVLKHRKSRPFGRCKAMCQNFGYQMCMKQRYGITKRKNSPRPRSISRLASGGSDTKNNQCNIF